MYSYETTAIENCIEATEDFDVPAKISVHFNQDFLDAVGSTSALFASNPHIQLIGIDNAMVFDKAFTSTGENFPYTDCYWLDRIITRNNNESVQFIFICDFEGTQEFWFYATKEDLLALGK